eukprot:GEMP01045078.1.p1 GENE.GEMP01045078.1~~GEMP01045078.1.p1  ORF type:complete len:110 (-),score=1.34 GEMP01045078.1:1179-1508(-)
MRRLGYDRSTCDGVDLCVGGGAETLEELHGAPYRSLQHKQNGASQNKKYNCSWDTYTHTQLGQRVFNYPSELLFLPNYVFGRDRTEKGVVCCCHLADDSLSSTIDNNKK